MPQKPLLLRVFLSGTNIDLVDYRTKVITAINKAGEKAVDMRYFPAQPEGAAAVSVANVAEADVVVLLIGWRYGTVGPGLTLSYSHLEYREAMRLHKPVLVFLAADNAVGLTRTNPLDPRVVAFREEVSHGAHVVDTFRSPDELATLVLAALYTYYHRKKRSWFVPMSAIIAGIVLIVGIIAFHNNLVTVPNPYPNTDKTATSSPVATTSPSPPIATQSSSITYTAPKPGFGCDTNGGQWSSYLIDKMSCPSSETQLVINPSNTQGYLYLNQLPHNWEFSSDNEIIITSELGGISSGYQEKCVGLGELNATAGYAGEYCNDGSWFIASTASDGTILTKVGHGVAATLTLAEISFTIKDNRLSFAIDSSPAATIPIAPFQPTSVAIIYNCVGYGSNATIGGNYLGVQAFSYVSPATS